MERVESHLEPPQARLLVVESRRPLRDALLSLLAQEGYAPSGVSTLEEALAALERQSYVGILADLFVGASRHAFTPAHILRRRAQPIPLGLITDQAYVLDAPQLAGFAFALPRPLDATSLLAELAACLGCPLDRQQQRQEQVIARLLTAWNAQEWRTLLGLCTEEVSYYPSARFPRAAGGPVQGKLALLGLMTGLRRGYHRVRVEVQGVYGRPHGLAVSYSGCAAKYGESWKFFGGDELFTFAGERICQIGTPLSEQQRRGLLELPDDAAGLGRSS